MFNDSGRLTQATYSSMPAFVGQAVLQILSVFLLILLAWEVRRILWTLVWKAPSNVRIFALPTPIGRWLTAVRMVFDSERVLQEAYDTCHGEPFAIPTLDRYVVFIPDVNQAERLEYEPTSKLSMEEALHELAFTVPILGEYRISPERNGSVGVGVLKNKLRQNMPALNDDLERRILATFDIEISGTSKQEDVHDWKQVRLVPMLLRVFTRVNLLILVGDDKADDPAVFDNMMRFFWDCARTFPILSFVPSFLHPIIAPMSMGWGIARRRIYGLIYDMTCDALDKRQKSPTKPPHMVQWTVETTRTREAHDIARMALGLVFASAFQVPMLAQSCLYRLCTQPQAAKALVEEAKETKGIPYDNHNKEKPFMDSFIKETARLGPGPILSVPRKVISEWISPQGIVVPAGNWVGIPQLALMRDPAVWSGGGDFDALRFVDEKGASTSRFTHPSILFPFWGSIKHACPARFYVSVVVKMLLTRLLLDYEFRLERPDASPFLCFGNTRLPSPFMTMMIRKRREAEIPGAQLVSTEDAQPILP